MISSRICERRISMMADHGRLRPLDPIGSIRGRSVRTGFPARTSECHLDCPINSIVKPRSDSRKECKLATASGGAGGRGEGGRGIIPEEDLSGTRAFTLIAQTSLVAIFPPPPPLRLATCEYRVIL
jgi:hypothetical protein